MSGTRGDDEVVLKDGAAVSLVLRFVAVVVLVFAGCGASTRPPGADGDIDGDADVDGDTDADADSERHRC